MTTTEQQRRANLKTAWALAALAALFGLGFFVRMAVFNG